jgi:hypothetical protein
VKRPRVDRTLVLAVASFVIFASAYATAVWLADRYYVVSAPAGSVYSSQRDGFKVFYGYLEGLRRDPQPLQQWDDLPPKATIVIAGPFTKPPTDGEIASLEKWVRAGGRLVAVGPEAAQLTRPLGLGASPSSAAASETLRPLFPGAYARGITTITPGPDRLLTDDTAWVAHYKDYAGQVLVTQKVGAGEVAWLAGAYPLSNQGIGVTDNGALALSLATAGGRAIWFDEYHHGYVSTAGFWERFGAGGRAAIVLSAIGLALALLGWGRRIGPVIPEVPEHAARGTAYIGQLAELYRKAGARGDALATLEDGLTRALARRHGTLDAGLARHPEAAEALAASRTLRQGSIDVEGFLATARRLGRARQEIEG